MVGRMLLGEAGDPYTNVALEEALLREAEVPTLRVWENGESVVIGRAQLAEFETDVPYCKEHSIPIVRRVTAGGTVYHGKGNLNWSFIMPRGTGPFREGLADAKGVFRAFADLVVGALGECGVDARFEAPNRISDGRGKISGMASYISREATLCHGTLLVDADLELATRLSTPKGELESRYPRSKPSGMSNCHVDQRKLVEALGRSGHGFAPGGLSDREKGRLGELDGKYRSEGWNLGDPFGLDYL